MILIHADLKVVPDKKQEFFKAVEPLVRGSQAEAGCVRYTLMQLWGDENSYTFVEEWKDQAAVDYHNATEHFQTFFKKAPEFVVGEMNVKVFHAPEAE